MPPEVVDVLRSTMPVEQLHEIGMAGCDSGCVVQVRTPEERACPYELTSDPTQAQQLAARRDSRCDGVGNRYTYFGGLSSSSGGMTFVIDETAAGAVLHLGAENAEPVTAAMRSGAVVVDDPRTLENGRVTLALREPPGPSGPEEARTVTAPGFALPERADVPVAVMTEETARSLGLSSTPTVTLATTSRMPTVEEQDRAQAALGDRFVVNVEQGRQQNNSSLVVLAIVAAIITLVASAIATGLAAADGRADLGTLAAVGASPRLRRALSMSQAGVIAGLGSLLGAVAGLAITTAVLFALNQREAGLWPAPAPYPISVPWLNIAIALLVVPLVATLGAGLMTGSRLPIERRL